MDLEEEEEKKDEIDNYLILNPNEAYYNDISNIIYIPNIKNLLEFIIIQNNINKKYKTTLFRIRGFDLISIFNEIDAISSGFINSKDLDEYLSKNNIKVEKDIIDIFIRQFAKEGKRDNLWKKDFINYFNYDINKNEIKLGELNFDKISINKNFLDLIKSEFTLIKKQNELINEIIQIKKFSTYEAFNIISDNKKYIDFNDLNKFLENKFQLNEIRELIYRIDLDNDKKISYEEFQDFFFPFQSHLHIDDLEEEKNEIESIIQNRYYPKLNSYENIFLSSPKIIDSKILEGNEIKINIKKDYEIKDNNEFNLDDIKKYDSEDLKIKYDEKLLNELDEEQGISNENNKENKEKETSSKYQNINNQIETNENLKDSNIIHNQNIINNQEENKNNFLKNSINILNKNDNNQNNILSKSEIILPNNDLNMNSFRNNENIPRLEFLTENDKDIVRYFIEYIHSLILLENLSENLKESITLCNDISLSNIFDIFNKDKDDLISKENFIKICKTKLYIYPTVKQIKLLFDRYDSDNDNILNQEEFMKMISPLKEEYLLLNKNNNRNKNFKEISFDSKKKIIELFKRLIENESLIYDLKIKLINEKYFNYVYLWGIMTKFSQDGKKLNKDEFNNFLEKFQCFLTQYELDVIFYKFSMGNNEIKYDSLYKEIITYN